MIIAQFRSTQVSLFDSINFLFMGSRPIESFESFRSRSSALQILFALHWPKKSLASPAIRRSCCEICATVLKLNQYLPWNCFGCFHSKAAAWLMSSLNRAGISKKIHFATAIDDLHRLVYTRKKKKRKFHCIIDRARARLALSANRFFLWGWANYMLLKVF